MSEQSKANQDPDQDKKYDVSDLRNELFDTLKKLKDGTIDVAQAKAITNVGQVIVNSAKVEVDFIKTMGGIGEGTGFIPLEPKKPKALNESKKIED